MTGIQRYLQILTLIENRIESPRVFLEYVDSIKGIYGHN